MFLIKNCNKILILCVYYIQTKTYKDMYTIVRNLNSENTFGEFDSIRDARLKAKELIESNTVLNLLVCEVINGIRKFLFAV